MRTQVAFEHVPLSDRILITFVETHPCDGPTVQVLCVDPNDAEDMLLAQAVDRFVKMQALDWENGFSTLPCRAAS